MTVSLLHAEPWEILSDIARAKKKADIILDGSAQMLFLCVRLDYFVHYFSRHPSTPRTVLVSTLAFELIQQLTFCRALFSIAHDRTNFPQHRQNLAFSRSEFLAV
jgi:hypothetical protein